MQEHKRSFRTLITDAAREPPMVMLFVAVAHILGLVWMAVHNWQDPMWLQLLWMLAYTVSWIAACGLRKWGGIFYIALTVLNIALYVFLKDANARAMYISNLFILDVMFSFILLYYFKRFS